MKSNRLLALLLGGLVLAGCADDLVVPDYNNPSLEELQDNPTRTAVVTAAQGLMIGARAGIANQPGYVAHLGILGRESYTFDNSDPRYVDEMVAGALDPGNGAFGGSGWAPRYANIRNGNIVLHALDKVTGFSDAEKEAIRGFVKTVQALDLLLVINMRHTNGAVIDVDRPIEEGPGDLVGREAVLTRVSTLLDEANTHLGGGGSAFPFALSSGFTGFDDPASFQELNRALKARVEVYRGNWNDALTALGESFLDPAGDLDLGAYHVYTSDAPNGLFNPLIVAHPSVRADAETRPNGALDNRVLRKTTVLDAPASSQGISTTVGLAIYNTLTTSVPIIRNEELILLRAEANIGLGNIPDAEADLNLIRTRSGGLSIRNDLTADNILDELLTQRRYSLLLEGHRWIDLRRYDRLDQLAGNPRAGDVVPAAFPIPRAECEARGEAVPCKAP